MHLSDEDEIIGPLTMMTRQLVGEVVLDLVKHCWFTQHTPVVTRLDAMILIKLTESLTKSGSQRVLLDLYDQWMETFYPENTHIYES